MFSMNHPETLCACSQKVNVPKQGIRHPNITSSPPKRRKFEKFKGTNMAPEYSSYSPRMECWPAMISIITGNLKPRVRSRNPIHQFPIVGLLNRTAVLMKINDSLNKTQVDALFNRGNDFHRWGPQGPTAGPGFCTPKSKSLPPYFPPFKCAFKRKGMVQTWFDSKSQQIDDSLDPPVWFD